MTIWKCRGSKDRYMKGMKCSSHHLLAKEAYENEGLQEISNASGLAAVVLQVGAARYDARTVVQSGACTSHL